jgi:group I intron endonuclease
MVHHPLGRIGQVRIGWEAFLKVEGTKGESRRKWPNGVQIRGTKITVCGVYVIENTVNGKLYIGSTANFQKRKNAHLSCLRRGVHVNKLLQHAFKKYGESAFRFALREVCIPAELQATEQRWLDSSAHRQLYNLYPTAYAVRGPDHPMYGHSHSVEARAKIKEARARQIVAHTAETRAKIGRAHKGRKLDPAHVAKMVAARKGQSVWNKGLTAEDCPALENKHKTVVTWEVGRRIRKLYLRGSSINALAREFGLDWGVVKRYLREAEIPTRSLRSQKIVYEAWRAKRKNTAAQSRIAYIFDHFDRIYVSFSGGKDSTVMLHLVMAEAAIRNRKVGVLLIDLEAQYALTMQHVAEMLELYYEYAEPYWVCLPLLLRNAVTQFEPRWCCWDPDARDLWVRPIPDAAGVISNPAFFPFYVPRMEFEEFMVLFGLWYGDDEPAAAFVGIRADESLNRFRTVASKSKQMFAGKQWTTQVEEGLYNVYPIYDWKTQDIWTFHAKTGLPHNALYDRMHLAGLSIHQMRICQPYGDDQRRGLWLYHIIEPQSWFKVVARVNGANSGAMYIQEHGNINGYSSITKPAQHTWKSFCNLLLASLPKSTREHYISKFRVFIDGWKGRGYAEIPDEAPRVLENAHWAPSWRRMCKVLLRNDHWCKGLGLTQPKSQAYERYRDLKRERKMQVQDTNTSNED